MEALVGPACEEDITVVGVQARCLMDSGSQVTLISEDFYRRHLQHLTLQRVP
jgi:hypothetical protein